MRIRKSVPEGYKTHSNFEVFSDSAPTTMHEQQVAESRMSGNGNMISNRPRARELTPFCGLLKIGGMAQQQLEFGYSPASSSPDAYMDDDYVPALSQGSTVSNDSVGTPGERKRRMDFDDEDSDSSPFEFTFSPHNFGSNSQRDRVMAVPRGRKSRAKTNVAVVGQENTDMDFEEAEFLDYKLLGEVEMGGV